LEVSDNDAVAKRRGHFMNPGFTSPVQWQTSIGTPTEQCDGFFNRLGSIALFYEIQYNSSNRAIGFFQFVHNAGQRGNSRLRSLVETLVCINPVQGLCHQ